MTDESATATDPGKLDPRRVLTDAAAAAQAKACSPTRRAVTTGVADRRQPGGCAGLRYNLFSTTGRSTAT